MERIKGANHNESPNEQYDETASILDPNEIKFAGDVKKKLSFQILKLIGTMNRIFGINAV